MDSKPDSDVITAPPVFHSKTNTLLSATDHSVNNIRQRRSIIDHRPYDCTRGTFDSLVPLIDLAAIPIRSLDSLFVP